MEDISFWQREHITMQLPEGADIREAQRVASLLNDNLAGFLVKRF